MFRNVPFLTCFVQWLNVISVLPLHPENRNEMIRWIICAAVSAMVCGSPEALREKETVSPASVETSADTLALGIEDVFGMIDSRNRTVRMLRTAVDAAEEGVKAAKDARLPDVDVSVNVSCIGDAFLTDRDFSGFTRTDSPHFGNGFTVDASQVIYAGGAVNAGIEMAGHGLARSTAELDKSRQGLRLMAAGQYLDLYRISNDIKVYEENISLTRRLIEDIQAKREQGLALANDVTRYELRLETLSLELVRLRNTAEVLNHNLRETLGLQEGAVIGASLPEQPAPECSSLADWQETARRSSPSIRLAEIESGTAETQRRIVKAEMLPSLALVAHDGFNGPITFEVPPIDKNLNIWYVGLGVNYSFGSLYKSKSKLRQAGFAARQARQAADVAGETLRNDVRQAYTDYTQSFIELETCRKSLQLATENYQRVHDRYMEQLALVTDMLDAFNVKLDAEIGVSDAEAERQYRLYKLKYVAGIL